MHKIAILLIFLFSVSLNSSGSDDLLKNVRLKLKTISPFKVKFLNQVLNNSEIEVEEKGEMTFINGNEIKWVYMEPEFKVWILRGSRYEYYNREDAQITRGNLERKAQLWIFRLLYTEDISKDIKVYPARNEIHFINEEEGADFRIELSADLLPVKITQKDPTGVEILYIFYDYENNVRIGTDEFKLQTDGDVDIIELN